MRNKNRFVTRCHYDTWEGWIDGYHVIDTLTGQQYGLYPRNRARYLAYKWNKQDKPE